MYWELILLVFLIPCISNGTMTMYLCSTFLFIYFLRCQPSQWILRCGRPYSSKNFNVVSKHGVYWPPLFFSVFCINSKFILNSVRHKISSCIYSTDNLYFQMVYLIILFLSRNM